MYSGYLNKLKRSGHGWIRRWFKLDNEKLEYFEDEEEIECKELIQVDKIFAVNQSPSSDKRNVLCLLTEDRTYFLQASDEKSMNTWMDKLQSLISHSKSTAASNISSKTSSPLLSGTQEFGCLLKHLESSEFKCENHSELLRQHTLVKIPRFDNSEKTWLTLECSIYSDFIILNGSELREVLLVSSIIRIHTPVTDNNINNCFLIISESGMYAFNVEAKENYKIWMDVLNDVVNKKEQVPKEV
eukprot:GHVP01021414.1.p1 GENE.GHVP01021414.1~~GHVP01021414.1.p1  ORF type:complete len:243 (-),score=40.52 GHVP01021414.1:277-1005(-)